MTILRLPYSGIASPFTNLLELPSNLPKANQGMNRNISLISVVFILLVSACAPRGTPTSDPIDIQNTAQAAAFTMVAETQAAVPSPTPVPPTETASPTLPPSNTPPPLPTSGTPGLIPTGAPTSSTQQALPTQAPPTSSSGNGGGTQDICNQPLTAWQGPTANFSIANQTRPQGTIILSMYVVTDLGQCGYLITGDSFSGPIGNYSAGAFITGKQNFKTFGSFRITEGSWSIVVKNDSIEARGGCYPNC